MEKRDFIYHFAEIYLMDAVSETILIENWEEKDFLYRYVEYSKKFLEFKSLFFDKDATEEKYKTCLHIAKARMVDNFNKKLGDNFKKELTKQGYKIPDGFMPNDIFSKTAINKDSLKAIRKYEEEANTWK